MSVGTHTENLRIIPFAVSVKNTSTGSGISSQSPPARRSKLKPNCPQSSPVQTVGMPRMRWRDLSGVWTSHRVFPSFTRRDLCSVCACVWVCAVSHMISSMAALEGAQTRILLGRMTSVVLTRSRYVWSIFAVVRGVGSSISSSLHS